MTITLSFSQDECQAAYDAWGCNCGPAALAAILGRPLDYVRLAVEVAGFAQRRYLSPTMMQRALRELGVRWRPNRLGALTLGGSAFPLHGLARVQWEGPWTEPGANPRWAYRHTHWVASWKHSDQDATAADAVWSALSPVVFDVNGGLMELERWEEEIVPLLTGSVPRAGGGWHVTHSWEIEL